MPARGVGIGYTQAAVDSGPGFGANLQTGHYYYLAGQTGKNATVWVDGALRLHPVVVVRPIIVDRLALDCTVGAASSNCKLVIYGSDAYGGTPVTNLYASGAISTVAAGIKEASSVATTLQPGVYWFGAVAYGGAPTISTCVIPSAQLVPFDLGASAPTTGDSGPISHQTTGLTTGTIPGTWAGVISAANTPRIIVKVG